MCQDPATTNLPALATTKFPYPWSQTNPKAKKSPPAPATTFLLPPRSHLVCTITSAFLYRPPSGGHLLSFLSTAKSLLRFHVRSFAEIGDGKFDKSDFAAASDTRRRTKAPRADRSLRPQPAEKRLQPRTNQRRTGHAARPGYATRRRRHLFCRRGQSRLRQDHRRLRRLSHRKTLFGSDAAPVRENDF